MTKNQDQLIALLEFCHPDKQILIHVPFLPDYSGKTALHICIEQKAFKAVDTILKCLALYPSDHHSKAIKNVYGDIVKLQPSNFDDYMESRIIQNEQFKNY